MKPEISKNANPNYLAKVVRLDNLRPHSNADRLQIATIDFQNVITSIDAEVGYVGVFFPLECKINKDFLSFTNSFRKKELNRDKECAGFFEENGRVRAVKLRGEKSMGYIVPIAQVEEFTGTKLREYVGTEFDSIGDILMCEKYVVKTRMQGLQGSGKNGRKPQISRVIDGQIHLHVDTENLRKNAFKINPEDMIAISYKLHGTSFWVSNVLGKKKLSIMEKILKFLGVKVVDTEYDFFYGSRKVVKNEFETTGKNDFYDGDLWGDVKNELIEYIPKGFTIYGEIVGYTQGGGMIQSPYDYGCQHASHKVYVYRITYTTPDGTVFNLSTPEVIEYCSKTGLNYVPLLYSGLAKDLYKIDVEQHWHENFIAQLEKDYTDKDCYMCTNKVPEEGIVLRKESLFNFEAFKLKSYRFLEYETKLLDEGTVDMESDN